MADDISAKRSAQGRSVARLAAVQALYQIELSDVGPEEAIEDFLTHRNGREVEGDHYAEADRTHLTRHLRCPGLVEAKIWRSGEDFALIWSRKNLDLEIVMLREDRLLWKGRHEAGRSDGGLPLSPLSAPIAVARASRLHGDSDAMVSLVDDTVRRIVASLPDGR